MNLRSIHLSNPAVIWLLVIVALAATISTKVSEPDLLRSNIFELLPHSDYDPTVAQAIGIVQSELSRRLVFLIGHEDQSIAHRAGSTFASALLSVRDIESIETGIDQDSIRDAAEFYFPYRRQLLTNEQILRVETDAGEQIEQTALASIYSGFRGTDPRSLTTDPFALFPQSLTALRESATELRFEDGFLWANDGSIHYMLLSATSTRSQLTSREQTELVSAVDRLIAGARDANPGLQIYSTGFLFYADAGTQSAKSEISIIGIGSILGIIVLMLSVFRSVKPLGLAALSIFCGTISAVAVTLLIFGSLHLFTLIFGASLIGVSIDYAFHFITERGSSPREKTTSQCLASVLPGISLGLMSSCVAYLALLVAPFPGLQQLAVFSATGLVGAYMTLICFAGSWVRPGSLAKNSFLFRACNRYLSSWARLRPRLIFPGIGILAIFAMASIANLNVDDSVSALQARPDALVAQEREIARITGQLSSSALVLVTGTDTESVLAAEEAAREILDRKISESVLSGYLALSRFVPSQAHQAASERSYDSLLEGRLESLYDQIGMESVTATDVAAAIIQASSSRLTIDTWLETELGRSIRFLWLDRPSGNPASIIQLQGISNLEDLTNALTALPNTRVVDQQTDFSTLFGDYRNRISILLGCAYVIVLLLLSLRYGLIGALVVLTPPVLASLLALATVSYIGGPVNLFNILALILVLGIGIDFTLFTAEAKGHGATTMFAISLSAATTMLSFGLLSFSTTYAVKAFGLTILLGIAFAFVLAPLANLRTVARTSH
jgi:predicted exporter